MGIEGFNKTFLNLISHDLSNLNVLHYLEIDQKLYLTSFFPEIFLPQNEQELNSIDGLSQYIDLTFFVETFHSLIIDDQISELDNFSLTKYQNQFYCNLFLKRKRRWVL
jgi:hypothetical protein